MKELQFFFFLSLSLLLYSVENNDSSSTFTTNEIVHENGNRTVTYAHDGYNASGHYHYLATFEHDTYDTYERVALLNFSIGYTPHEKHEQDVTQDQALDNPSQLNSFQNSYEISSFWNNADYQEYAKNRNFDNHDRITAQQQTDGHDVCTDEYGNQLRSSRSIRSKIYLWCKGIKEIFIGPSKETRQAEQKRCHERDTKDQQIRALQKQAIEQKNQQIKLELEQAYDEHKIASTSSADPEFLKIMQQRDLPFELSLQNQQRTIQKFSLNSATIGLLQAYNIDHRQFTQLHGFAIEHQLTQELIVNLNTLADIADAHGYNQQLFSLMKANLLVIDMAQNYNKNCQLLDAISATNCSHGFVYCLQGMTMHGIDRCQKMVTSLSFFSCEIAKYSFAAAKGIAQGVVASELASVVMSGCCNLAASLAPELTASVYAGATTIMVPIAITAGALCSIVLVGELGNYCYLYATDQIEKLNIELERIKNFAGQFYNFDQAPVAHVENLARCATALLWPWQRDAIFNSLMGMQKVYCNAYLGADQTITSTRFVTKNQLHDALEFIKNPELIKFKILYKKIFDEHVFDIFPSSDPELVVAGMNNVLSSTENTVLANIILKNESSIVGNVVKTVGSGVLSRELPAISKEVKCAIDQMIENSIVLDVANETISAVSAPQVALNNAEKIIADAAKAKELSDKLHELTKSDPAEVQAFEKTIEPYLNSENLVDIKHLQSIEGVEQINKFKEYTNNFTDLAKLKPEEVLYLNLCDWLEPQAKTINARLKKLAV